MITTLTIENENDLVPQSTALLHKKRVVLGVNWWLTEVTAMSTSLTQISSSPHLSFAARQSLMKSQHSWWRTYITFGVSWTSLTSMQHLVVTSRHMLMRHDLSRCLGALWFVWPPAFLVAHWSLVTIRKWWSLTGSHPLKAPCRSCAGLLSSAMLNMKYSPLLLVIASLWLTTCTVTSHQCPS